MSDWKRRAFKGLRDGDRIFESACGIGLNLYLTLELLGIRNIQVFGNEYYPASVRVARDIILHLPHSGRPGRICAADSTHLDYVPSNTFDLVFTGYISPLFNPLQLEGPTTDANFATYLADCKTVRSQTAQRIQNDWYAAWVSEMIRIARPGAPVIVEQVSYPLCEAPFDWGGVAQEFWKTAIEDYGWPIDPDSIVMVDDTLFKRRYHVYMEKKLGV